MIVFKDGRVGSGLMEKIVGPSSVLEQVEIGGAVKHYMIELIKVQRNLFKETIRFVYLWVKL